LGSLDFALSWFPSSTPNVFDTNLSSVFVIIITSAIVLLGPGALSLDARLFGCREIIIPAAHARRDLDGFAGHL
jgi:hypothetical protein